MRLQAGLCVLLLSACGPSSEHGEDDSDATGAQTDPERPEPAALITPTMACPELPAPGSAAMTSIGSGDTARDVWIAVPEDTSAPMPLWFGWHGLTQVGVDPAYRGFAQPLGLEDLAMKNGAVMVVPAAQVANISFMQAYLWGILDEESHQADLALFDNLRACLADALPIDLSRVSSFGFSGGGLWTSVLLMDRADSLAAAVTFSGGVDVLGTNAIMAWRAPSVPVRAAVFSGGVNDQWPGGGLALIDFDAGSDALTTHLQEHGDTVVRCDHNLGHSPPPSAQRNFAWRFLKRATYGVPNDWEGASPDNVPEGCEVVTP